MLSEQNSKVMIPSFPFMPPSPGSEVLFRNCEDKEYQRQGRKGSNEFCTYILRLNLKY